MLMWCAHTVIDISAVPYIYQANRCGFLWFGEIKAVLLMVPVAASVLVSIVESACCMASDRLGFSTHTHPTHHTQCGWSGLFSAAGLQVELGSFLPTGDFGLPVVPSPSCRPSWSSQGFSSRRRVTDAPHTHYWPLLMRLYWGGVCDIARQLIRCYYQWDRLSLLPAYHHHHHHPSGGGQCERAGLWNQCTQLPSDDPVLNAPSPARASTQPNCCCMSGSVKAS